MIVLDGTTGITTPTTDSTAEHVTSVTGFKNRIINGGMVIDQRNAGASVSTASGIFTYTVDRWRVVYSATSKFTIQQNAGSVTPPIGFTNYLGCTSSSAYSVGSNEVFILQHLIEGFNVADLGFGTANAKTVTLSFQVYSSLTGTFGGSLKNSAENRTYPFSFSIPVANTWTTVSITVAGDTTGTWLTTNGIGLCVTFSLGAGATSSGTAGSWSANNYSSATGATSVVGTSGATFYITGVQLEKGSVATSFDYRPYGTELQLCQRYYEIAKYESSSNDFCVIATIRTTDGLGDYYFKVTKRAAPTAVVSALSDFICLGSGYASLALTGLAIVNFTNYAAMNPTVATGFLALGATTMRITGVNGYVSFSAEL